MILMMFELTLSNCVQNSYLSCGVIEISESIRFSKNATEFVMAKTAMLGKAE